MLLYHETVRFPSISEDFQRFQTYAEAISELPLTARLSKCFPASEQMYLHKVPLLWIRHEEWLLEWNGKCICPEMKAPQTQPGIPLKRLTVDLYTCGFRFSCGAVLPGQAFEFWKASNNNFSKRYRVVHTKSDLLVRKPCTAVSHPASIEVPPVCLASKKKDP